jgi:hypothetical protein
MFPASSPFTDMFVGGGEGGNQDHMQRADGIYGSRLTAYLSRADEGTLLRLLVKMAK